MKTKLFHKMLLPLTLFSILILTMLFGSLVPVQIKAFFYTLSLSMKSLLLFVLPFIIFSFIFFSMLNLKRGVFNFIVLLVVAVFISNSLAIFTGFSVGLAILPKLPIAFTKSVDSAQMLLPIWKLTLPVLIPNQIALTLGFAFGLIFSLIKNQKAADIANLLNNGAHFFLKKIFIPLLPLFILGFMFKLEHDQLLQHLVKLYGPIFIIVLGTQITYISFLYLMAANFSLKTFITYVKNVLPAILTGFSTVSSAATMPYLVLCSEKNLPSPHVADIVIPATINIHTLGSAIGLTIISLTTLLIFGHDIPPVHTLLLFGFYYALAKFAVAAVPGGVIIVAAPLLEQYLGFSGEMIGLITAMYMLFDPFGTAMNVAGNGFFPIMFSKIFNFDKHSARAPIPARID